MDNFYINYLSIIPISDQLKFLIKGRIKRGTLKEGDLLPSLNKLSQSISISKSAVKEVYKQLEAEGVIVYLKAKGYCISQLSCMEKMWPDESR